MCPEASPLQRLVNLFRRVTCQRRNPERYEAMLAVGHQVPLRKQEEWHLGFQGVGQRRRGTIAWRGGAR